MPRRSIHPVVAALVAAVGLAVVPGVASAAGGCSVPRAATVAQNETTQVLVRSTLHRSGPSAVPTHQNEAFVCSVKSGKLTRVINSTHPQPGFFESVKVAGHYAGILYSYTTGNGPNDTQALTIWNVRTGTRIGREFQRNVSHCQCAGIGTFVLNAAGSYAFSLWPASDTFQISLWKVEARGTKRTSLGIWTDYDDQTLPDVFSLAITDDGRHVFWLDRALQKPNSASLKA